MGDQSLVLELDVIYLDERLLGGRGNIKVKP